jgi:hypothetical protein
VSGHVWQEYAVVMTGEGMEVTAAQAGELNVDHDPTDGGRGRGKVHDLRELTECCDVNGAHQSILRNGAQNLTRESILMTLNTVILAIDKR